jgi:regulator of protease activity HflC (stomatin/prohibitin superfamily)
VPGTFITFIVLISIGLVVTAIGRVARKAAGDDDELAFGGAVGTGIGLAACCLALLFLALSCFDVVSTRNVGVVTSFGRPVATRSNGLVEHWPWQQMSELSGTIETDSQTGGFDDKNKCTGGTTVRLGNNAAACVDNTIRWRIVPAAGDELFRDYRDDANIRDSLVTRELNATLNGYFASYNPLSPDANAAAPSLADISDRVTKALQENPKVKGRIDIQNVIIPIVHFDTKTQGQIDAYQQQIAQTRVAQESEKTAAAQAEANRILADSISKDPGVIAWRCLDLIDRGKQLQPGFQCPGSGVAAPQIIVPAK